MDDNIATAMAWHTFVLDQWIKRTRNVSLNVNVQSHVAVVEATFLANIRLARSAWSDAGLALGVHGE